MRKDYIELNEILKEDNCKTWWMNTNLSISKHYYQERATPGISIVNQAPAILLESHLKNVCRMQIEGDTTSANETRLFFITDMNIMG